VVPNVSDTAHITGDDAIMRRCLELARRGWGRVEPNPAVGCVIVAGNAIVSEGWHREFGKAHAEIEAFQRAGDAARDATLCVSLEPCSRFGKTPPCTEAIKRAKIRKVIFGAHDDTQHGGQILRDAGVEVHGGLLAGECRRENPYFFHVPSGDRPFVMAKWAMSRDFRITTPP